MLVGVVSDTHNRVGNVRNIISLFNSHKVELVIHTGDITKAQTLSYFSELNCPLKGVYGNNDLNEPGLEDTSVEFGFEFVLPPLIFSLGGIKVAVFHEPEGICSLIKKEKGLNLILHGHTHRYRDEFINGIKIFNPGECAGSLRGKNAVGLVNTKNLKTERIFF